ncbi:hypothetical protein SeLEV6574_g02355 [Synchytrium endobioticum]|nr:hypothetical protein SeLEV6574_g02355 [Synchytrium endobioticum]
MSVSRSASTTNLHASARSSAAAASSTPTSPPLSHGQAVLVPTEDHLPPSIPRPLFTTASASAENTPSSPARTSRGRPAEASQHGARGASPTPPTTSTVHPSLDDLPALDEYITSEPSNLLQILPDLINVLERFCLDNPDTCQDVWSRLKVTLEWIERRKATIAMSLPAKPDRPTSPACAPFPQEWNNVHNQVIHDDYAYLNQKDNSQVLDYIDRENAYSSKMLANTKPLQKLLYKEFVSRIDEAEGSASVIMSDGYEYYTKKIPGEEYRVHSRRNPETGVEEVYLNENELANSPAFADASFFHLGFAKHSHDMKLVAYGVDLSGNERNSVSFINLETKETLMDRLEGVYEDLEFSNDSSCVYYTLLDEHERAYQLKRHLIGSDVATDQVLYHEEDEMFFLTMTKSCNGEYIILNSSAQVTSESRYISANAKDLPVVLIPRKENIQYTVENHDSWWYILTNDDAKNKWMFRVPALDKMDPKPCSWEEWYEHRETVIEHRDFVLIEDYQLRRNHLVVFERSNCLQNIRIIDLTAPGFSAYHYVGFGEMVYSLWPGSVNEEVADLSKTALYDTNILRFTYTSFVQPKQVVDYNMDTKSMTVVHEERVNGDVPYDPSVYASRRLFATGSDGTTVPISLVYRRDLLGSNMNPPVPNPCLLHSYGAYGACTNPIFSTSRLSLLDRGFVYAIAHVRGGAEMGNAWYEEGKLWKKPNTFNDFVSTAEYLCKEGYTSPSKLAIYGRSAGGLLIGASVNMRPELFRSALTEVPFVDVINTMFDTSIPWVSFEYEEWGNPTNYDIYECMKSYCPYTNVNGERLARNEYPHMLIVGGLNDPRVAFFEPLKWVAKMRGERRKWRKILEKQGSRLPGSPLRNHSSMRVEEDSLGEFRAGTTPGVSIVSGVGRTPSWAGSVMDSPVVANSNFNVNGLDGSRMTEERMILLRINDAGHGGTSGTYSYLEDLALEYAFLIYTLGAPMRPIFPGFKMSEGPSLLQGTYSGPAATLYGLHEHASAMRPQVVDGVADSDGKEYEAIDRDTRSSDEESLSNDRRLSSCNYNSNKKRKGGGNVGDVEETEYRSRGNRGDRGQSRLYQWLANWF